MEALEKYVFRYYYQSLVRLIFSPQTFFSKYFDDSSLANSIHFLLHSCVVFVMARMLIQRPENILFFMAAIFVNSVGMVFLFSSTGYLLMGVMDRKQFSFSHFFSIYAYASGTILFFAWIPSSLLPTEIWRWWLIGTGLVCGLGLKWFQVLLIIGCSVLIAIILVQYLFPLL